MKTKLLFMLLSFLCLNLFSQSYLVNDHFEDDALGVLPAGWIIRFNGTGNANQKIVDSPVKNGIHSFQLYGSSWAANLSKTVTEIPNEVSLKGWMRAENVATGGRCGLGIGNPSIGSWGAYLARVEFYNGNLITFNYTGNSGGYGTQYVLQTASPQTWYLVKIEVNRVAGTYKVYINGELASSNTTGTTITEFPLLTTVSPTSVELYGNSLIYFDDIKLYETTNLVAYYPFNGNADDESENDNNGIVNGATLTTDRFGNENSAYNFDGIDDFIEVLNSNSINITGTELTISMWLNNEDPDTNNLWKGISKGGYDNSNGYELLFTNYNIGNISLNIGNGGYFVGSFDTNNTNKWIMLTATYSSTGGKVYINDVAQSTSSQGSINLIPSSSNLFIGKRSPGNNYNGFVKGKIDDIRIYNTALSEIDISNLYANNTLKVEKIEDANTAQFYIFNNILYFKKTQNISEIKAIEIYNLLGQQVFKTSDIKEQIAINGLHKGIYIFKVEKTNGNHITLKSIIE